jgi:hypothetical protein
MAFWSKKKPAPDPAVAAELRSAALRRTAADLGVSPSGSHPHVFGVAMETAYPEACATLVVFAEGSTSLYFSNGGGVIGAGDHAAVRATHSGLFAEAEAHLKEFAPASDLGLPTPGHVRFFLWTFKGLLSADGFEDDLGNMRHALSPVFFRAQAVISAIRESSGG